MQSAENNPTGNVSASASDLYAQPEGALPETRDASRHAFRVLLLANALVFSSSMCIMILELVAARLVARHLGSSLYTWTSVIGVILGGMSLGNYLGGRLADRFVPRRILGTLFLLASVVSLSVLWLNQSVGAISRPMAVPWPMWVLVTVAATFLLPACMLGTISPVVAKMALDEHRGTGTTVGNIYAWGAVGSIVGTFLTGFVLINQMGTNAIVCAVAGGLAVLGIFFTAGQWRLNTATTYGWLPVVALVSVPAVGPWPWAQRLGWHLGVREDYGFQYFDESNYYSIYVHPDAESPNVRVLILDNLVHAYVPMDDPKRLEYEYEKIYASITQRMSDRGRPPRALFLGGGGFVFPRYFEVVYPGSHIDVAEIDPAVKRVSQKVLTLPPDDKTRIRTYLMDARNFVDDRLREIAVADSPRPAEAPALYDFVYGDAFSDFSIPFHLTTYEFNEKVKRLMAPEGVYMQNVIDIFREGACRFLSAYVATVRETFPYVYVFCTAEDGPSAQRDTFVVVCSLEPLSLENLGKRPGEMKFKGRLFAWSEGGVPGGRMDTLLRWSRGITLRDDFAPVDNLLTPVVRDHFESPG